MTGMICFGSCFATNKEEFGGQGKRPQRETTACKYLVTGNIPTRYLMAKAVICRTGHFPRQWPIRIR